MKPFKVIYRPFPEECEGMVKGAIMERNNRVLIVIDSSQDEETQQRTLRHELAHLALDHLAVTKPVDQIDSSGDDMFGEGWQDRERAADRYADSMTDNEFAELMQYAIAGGTA